MRLFDYLGPEAIALYREMLYLIEQDVLSVEEADTAVSYGPGLRCGVMCQSLQWHVGGGAGGIQHFKLDASMGALRLGYPWKLRS